MKGARPLTQGEIALARTMFGAAIDYDRVTMVRRRWWPLQPKGIVMAPSGNIHFHPDDPNWREDYADAPLLLQGLFMHEMTHVWQAQKGGRWFLPLMRHPFCRYDYAYREGHAFGRYGIEQQAEIVRHLFLIARGQAITRPEIAGIAANLPFRLA